MTKPKNPYPITGFSNPAWEEGYATGLHDGEKRLARALRQFIDEEMFLDDSLAVGKVYDWLSARLKKERKK